MKHRGSNQLRVHNPHRPTTGSSLFFTAIVVCTITIGCQTSKHRVQAKTGLSITPDSVPQAVNTDVERAEPRLNETGRELQTVSFQPSSLEESAQSESPSENGLKVAVISDPDDPTPPFIDKPARMVPPGAADSISSYPIDLTTAMRLAGASHLQIQLASERIREACARLDQAEVLWIPNVSLGVGYNRHDGPIQDTEGKVSHVSRQSLYFGGGPAIGGSPLSGGASGPARLFVDLSTADVYFEPLAARQNVIVNQHAQQVAVNDNILQVGLAYQELVRAQLQVGIADEAIRHAEELVQLTESFETAGKGLAADTQRARAEWQQRRHQRAVALERVEVSSVELARLLRLDQSTRLVSPEPLPIPIELILIETPIESLVSQGLTFRPELAQHQARVQETLTRIRQEEWRPWLPHLFVGYAGAGFGGGSNSDIQNFGVRGDFDALAVWQVQNLGLGNRALRSERESQHRQAHLQFEWIRDQIIADVSQAYARARYRKEQMEYAQQQVIAAADALPLNLKGIRDGVIRPIEAQQAIASLASARSLYLASVIDFNQAQLQLIRALGDSQPQ